MSSTPSQQALVETLARMQREIDDLKRGTRTPQLPHSALGPGQHIAIVDTEGRTAGRIGYQPDGGIGIVPDPGTGDPPPRPSTPQVAGGPSGVIAVWDGRLIDDDGDLPLPSTFDHVSVHVIEGDDEAFEPTAATFVGTIPRAGGAFPVVPLPVGQVHTVRLVAVTTSGVEGAPSEAATGTPEAVGGVPEPGSITEVELADDSVTAPKVRAEAIEAWHIVAQAIETGHLQAQAVTAAKLAAEIVLASRLIAGNPGADRVEIDGDGLRGYNDNNELIFAIADGDAVFSGTVTGSEITGSRILMGAAPDPHGAVEETPTGVQVRVQHGGHLAQLRAAADQANFLAVRDSANPSTPAAGFSTTPTGVQFVLDSSLSSADGLPSVTGHASATSAQLALWSVRNSLTDARAVHIATPGGASSLWEADSGAAVQAVAQPSWSGIFTTPEDSTAGQPIAAPGSIYAFRRAATDAPTLSFQSPMSETGPGAGRRSIIHVEGANTARPHTIINSAARRHYLQGEVVDGATDTADGVVELASTHSLYAPRHHTTRTDMEAQPTQNSVGGQYVDFTISQMPSRTFTTSWSGLTRIIIQMCGINYRTDAATIALGFRLSGTGAVPAALARSAMARSAGPAATAGRPAFQVVDLDLVGNATYTLTPAWRISGNNWPWGEMHSFDLSYQNSIIIEPLM